MFCIEGRHHEITFAGSINTETVLDPIYWLNVHLQKFFCLDLSNWPWSHDPSPTNAQLDSNKHDLDERMWGWGPDSMALNFRNTWNCAGYEAGIFSFHSLRQRFGRKLSHSWRKRSDCNAPISQNYGWSLKNIKVTKSWNEIQYGLVPEGRTAIGKQSVSIIK